MNLLRVLIYIIRGEVAEYKWIVAFHQYRLVFVQAILNRLEHENENVLGEIASKCCILSIALYLKETQTTNNSIASSFCCFFIIALNSLRSVKGKTKATIILKIRFFMRHIFKSKKNTEKNTHVLNS